ncbi:hypothetical protein [Pedobacter polysacchareus]|uniref:hypothetical protein n=1 Tax=Pedobacter polysacchareus TaxID=2861973 RepID=UPI001C99CC2F|nr:hypothetical protein [Pedobacter polysacchareus]
MAQQWYIRVSGGDPKNPEHYTPSGPTPPACPGSGKVCAVYAEAGNPNRPDLTQALLDEIKNALDNGVDTQNVLLRAAN